MLTSLMLKPGTKVLITRDVRDVEQKADGQIGIYEGDFPISAVLWLDGKVGEYEYAKFLQWNAARPVPIPTIQEAMSSGNPDWENAPYYYINDNPRIILPDGSHIWGYECWWGVAEGAPPLEEAQAQTEDVITTVRAVLNGEEGNATNESP